MGTDRAGKLILRPWVVARNEYMQLNNYISLTTSGRHGAHAPPKFNFLGQLDRLVFDDFPKGEPVSVAPQLQGPARQAVAIAIVSIRRITGLLEYGEVVVVDPKSLQWTTRVSTPRPRSACLVPAVLQNDGALIDRR